ncbi:DNA-binding CsgD family transcriptional regulator [Mycobacterium sp. MAA66]|uniref:helix-turn-helix transcriptional regulator n=1 Tax=Mycobacterium sp. MAA66 TaxID=3156297 RepID=UPI003513D5C7
MTCERGTLEGDPAMVAVGEFSHLVSSIYHAAIHPEDWPAAMVKTAEVFGADGAGLVMADGISRRRQCASIPDEAIRDYDQYYRHIDYVLEAVESGPVGLVRGGQPLAALRPDAEFHLDWMRRHHLDDGLFVRLTDDRMPACFLIATRKRSEPFDNAEHVELANALVPHFQQALRIDRDMHDVTHHMHDISNAMDDVTRVGMAIVGAGPSVRYLNSAAEKIVARQDGLCIQGGVFEIASPRVDVALHRAINTALGHCESAVASGNSLLCPRPSGLRPYVIHVLPVRRTAADYTESRALLLIIDPEQQPEPAPDLLRRLYSMTNAEAAVAIRLLQCDGIKPIAESMCLSTGTVKTHLQHIFDKTGTHRQAELVRLLMAIAL